LIYVLDLTEPDGMFNARDFAIRDGDTVYVTEAHEKRLVSFRVDRPGLEWSRWKSAQ
jgi:hypothetical protein